MLTSNHLHYIRSLLAHVEHEVQDGIAMLEGDDPAVLFPRYADYPAAARIAVLRTHLARLRSVMRRFMDGQPMAQQAPLPTVDASWGFQTRMSMARNAVFELRPRYVRGYGELDAQGEQDCRALAAELGLLLDDITHELRRQPLAIPENRRDDALLVALTEAIERHQLLELRGTVRNLLEGQEGDRVEVALLGRVSSGKSSLVNALLGQPLLPVGAVPVTAVVTRVRHGDVLRIRAIDLEGHAEEIGAEVLPQYIAESGNAGNRRRLREVTIEVPADILHGGIVLTDTPGLGSLHATASAHALTYLPRCDLGIITIDASATLSMQDADLARALQQAHASLLVLLTKADTVAPDALAQQRDYVQRALSEALGEPVRVADVSVAPTHAGTLQRWRDSVLRPALARCAARSGERAGQRLDQLARRVCVMLEQALHERPTAAETTTRQGTGKALAALSDAETALRNLCSELGQHGVAVVLNDALPLAMADASDITEQVAALASQLADQVVRDMVARLQAVSSQADDGQRPASLRGAPPFVLAALPAVSLQRYAVRGPSPWRRYRLRQRLYRDMHRPLQQTFLAYAQELKDWLTQACESMRQSVGGVTLATDGIRADQATIRKDLAQLHALLGEDPAGAS